MTSAPDINEAVERVTDVLEEIETGGCAVGRAVDRFFPQEEDEPQGDSFARALRTILTALAEAQALGSLPDREVMVAIIRQSLWSPASGPVNWTREKIDAANDQAGRIADAIRAACSVVVGGDIGSSSIESAPGGRASDAEFSRSKWPANDTRKEDIIPAAQASWLVITITDDRCGVEDFIDHDRADEHFFSAVETGYFRDVLMVYRHKGDRRFYQGMWTGYAKRDAPPAENPPLGQETTLSTAPLTVQDDNKSPSPVDAEADGLADRISEHMTATFRDRASTELLLMEAYRTLRAASRLRSPPPEVQGEPS